MYRLITLLIPVFPLFSLEYKDILGSYKFNYEATAKAINDGLTDNNKEDITKKLKQLESEVADNDLKTMTYAFKDKTIELGVTVDGKEEKHSFVVDKVKSDKDAVQVSFHDPDVVDEAVTISVKILGDFIVITSNNPGPAAYFTKVAK